MTKIEDDNVREELRNVVDRYPLWIGETISRQTAHECARRGWLRRQTNGSWIPTAKGIAAVTPRGRRVELRNAALRAWWAFCVTLVIGYLFRAWFFSGDPWEDFLFFSVALVFGVVALTSVMPRRLR